MINLNIKNSISLLKSFAIMLLLGVFISNISFAQKGKHKLGDRYFTELDYKAAGKVYDDILEKIPDDITSLRRSGFCHDRFGNIELAASRYKKLTTFAACTPDDLISYANVLKKLKNYDEAVRIYKKYSELRPEEKWVKPYFEDGNWIFKIIRDSLRFDMRISKVNTEYSDFSPTFALDKVIFSSARPEGKSKKSNSEKTNYLNLFEATVMADGSLTNPKLMENDANSKYHEGTSCYDALDKNIYFTRNNFIDGKKGKALDGNLNLALFYGSYSQSTGMGVIHEFKFNNPEYSVGHASISEDGQTMIFISDMPGGFGGTDLYMSKKNGTNWDDPINLGSEINTPGNEMFPFIYNDEQLYFSSDGHPGLGGLDIFVARWQKLNYPKVENLGYPLNTAFDDFSFILFRDGEKGYVSSDRPHGKGGDDIYEINIKPSSYITISGHVLDIETQQPITNATILLKDSSNTEVVEVMANTRPDGYYEFEVAYNSKYTIIAVKNGYFQGEINLTTRSSSGYIDEADIEMLSYDYAIEGKVLDMSTNEILPSALVSLYSAGGELLNSTRADRSGKYFFGLDENTAYIIEAEKPNYSKQKINIDTRNKPSTLIYSDFRLFKLERGTVIPLDNILWDLASHKVNSGSKAELDKVVQYMNDYPTMMIELSSHTDCRGGNPYNMSLSQRRAASAVKYIVSRGIPTNRILSKGYGETLLKNRCADGVDCSEEEHQVNRRTEFKILEI